METRNNVWKTLPIYSCIIYAGYVYIGCKLNIPILKLNFVIMILFLELIECHKYSVCRQRFSEMASVQFVAGLTPTEGDGPRVKILDDIQEALLLYLNDCKVSFIRFKRETREEERGTENEVRQGAIVLLRDLETRIVPHLAGGQLVYKQIFEVHHTMFLCNRRRDNGLRILYHWYARGRHFITAPYFDPKSKVSVWCYTPMDVTAAVCSRKPVAVVEKMLEEMKYREDRFLWMMHGCQERFEISEVTGKLFWRDEDKGGGVNSRTEKLSASR